MGSIRRDLKQWRLPQGGPLLDRVERMIRPSLLAGHFGSSSEHFLCGLQYHLGGAVDTEELAELAGITAADHVLDVCCYLGGPAIQLADTIGCRVTGVDIRRDYVEAANRIAELAGLARLATFRAEDAGSLPFDDGAFTVVWNQGSLMHYSGWLREFDRVLAPAGRLAITFEIGDQDPSLHDSRWPLEDVTRFVATLGYAVEHAEDISARDIEIGWRALDRRLTEQEAEFTDCFGEEWVRQTHEEFASEIEQMRAGVWGNGRLVARKLGHSPPPAAAQV